MQFVSNHQARWSYRTDPLALLPGKAVPCQPIVSLGYLFFHLFTLQGFILVDCLGRAFLNAWNVRGLSAL